MSEPEQDTSVARPPTPGEMATDRTFRGLTYAFAWFTILVVVLIVGGIGRQAWPVMHRFGTSPITSDKWDAGKEQFGLLPEIWGTVYSSVLGVAIGSLFGVAVAIFLTQDYI